MRASIASEKQSFDDPMLEACLATLRSLGPSVEVALVQRSGAGGRTDGELDLRLGRKGRRERFVFRTTRTHLSYALTSGFIEEARVAGQNWLLLAPYVPAKIGQHLAAHQLSYADAVGNCHLQVADGRELLAHVEGKKPLRDGGERSAGRSPSYQLIFAILAQPALLAAPVRQIAIAAGVGKTAAADQLKRLAEQGLIERKRSGTPVARRRELLDRWLSAYADVVRPGWQVGRYRTKTTDPEELERQIATIWGDQVWAFGGGAAAWRMAQFYRGSDTVLHVHSVPTDMLRQLRAIPAPDGELTILRTPGAVAYNGVAPHVAHPLMVYSEMVTSREPRMREAADEIRERFLKD
jgi:hypothetical protein